MGSKCSQFEALLFAGRCCFFKEIGCTSKVLERFKNDRIIVKTVLAWCPKPDPHGSAVLYYRHSSICTRAYQRLRSSGPQR